MLFIKTSQQSYWRDQGKSSFVLYFFEAKPFSLDYDMLKKIEDLTKKEASRIELTSSSTFLFKKINGKQLFGLQITQENRRKSLAVTSIDEIKAQCCFTSEDFEGKKIKEVIIKIILDNYKNYFFHGNPVTHEYKIIISRASLVSLLGKDVFKKKKVLESPSKMKDYIFNLQE